MSKPTIPKTKPSLKFGKETRQFSVRLPLDLCDKIKNDKIDASQILFDVIEGGMNPYEKQIPDNDIGLTLTKKLIELMIDNGITAPEGHFTDTETTVIMDIARGVVG